MIQRLDAAHAAIAAVMDLIAKAQQLAAAALQGGQPGPILARLDAIREIMMAVAQRSSQAKDHITDALAEARTTGDKGN